MRTYPGRTRTTMASTFFFPESQFPSRSLGSEVLVQTARFSQLGQRYLCNGRERGRKKRRRFNILTAIVHSTPMHRYSYRDIVLYYLCAWSLKDRAMHSNNEYVIYPFHPKNHRWVRFLQGHAYIYRPYNGTNLSKHFVF